MHEYTPAIYALKDIAPFAGTILKRGKNQKDSVFRTISRLPQAQLDSNAAPAGVWLITHDEFVPERKRMGGERRRMISSPPPLPSEKKRFEKKSFVEDKSGEKLQQNLKVWRERVSRI